MVSERQIKTLAAKKKALISDKNFFTSKVLHRYFTELAAMLTQRYGFKLAIKVKLTWLNKDPHTGHDFKVSKKNVTKFMCKKTFYNI